MPVPSSSAVVVMLLLPLLGRSTSVTVHLSPLKVSQAPVILFGRDWLYFAQAIRPITLQLAEVDGRAGHRHHQGDPGLPPVLTAWPGSRGGRMVPGMPGVQLEVITRIDGGLVDGWLTYEGCLPLR
jgi:hypothetical protein